MQQYVTRTELLFDELDENEQQKCRETYDLYEDKTPELWAAIVDFYHRRYTAVSADWFPWWEDYER